MSSTPRTGRPSKGTRAKHTLRLPLGLDAALRAHAEQHNRSLNDALVAILSAALSSTPEQVADACGKAARWKKPGDVPVRTLEHLAS